MIQLRSILNVADNTGATKLIVIQLHGGSKRRFSYLGGIVGCVVRVANPQSQFKKGDMVKAVLVRARKETRRPDGSCVRFDDNAAVVIDNLKDKNPKGTRIFGPIAREVKDAGFAKIASMAPEVI